MVAVRTLRQPWTTSEDTSAGGNPPPWRVRVERERAVLAVIRQLAGITWQGERSRRRQVPADAAPARVPRTDFDPLAAATITDPYPAYERLRAQGRVLVSARHQVWLLHRQVDVNCALRDGATFSSADGLTIAPRPAPSVLFAAPPGHTRLRKAVSVSFTRAPMARLEVAVRARAAGCLRPALALPGPVDVVPSLCIPLPVGVICDLLGVPEAYLPRVRAWSDRVADGFADSSTWQALRGSGRILGALLGFRRMVLDELARRATHLGGGAADDVLSVMHAAMSAGQLDVEDTFWMAFTLLVAGNETTVNLLGSVLHVLATDPDLQQSVRADPGLVPALVEEVARVHSPVQWVARTTTRAVEVGGVRIPERSRVVLLIGAANRDPDRYSDPDRVDLTRRRGDHLGFGAGIHYCLGAQLARLETRVAVEEVLAATSGLSPAGPVRWAHNPSLRGPAALPLHLHLHLGH